jgi:hypothetical protein
MLVPVDHPDVVLGVDADRVREFETVEALANLSHEGAGLIDPNSRASPLRVYETWPSNLSRCRCLAKIDVWRQSKKFGTDVCGMTGTFSALALDWANNGPADSRATTPAPTVKCRYRFIDRLPDNDGSLITMRRSRPGCRLMVQTNVVTISVIYPTGRLDRNDESWGALTSSLPHFLD